MAREIEAKLKVESLEPIRQRLDDLGAVNEGECLERNWVLDDFEGNLRRRGILLRIRSQGGADGILTIKHPVEDGGEFKTREEVETMVDSTGDLLRQYLILGYRVEWIYEKFRQTWLWNDCVLALDECPEIGSFVEIEGSPVRIREAAADLGLDPERHIEDNYLGLWIKHLEALGQAPRHMVFDGSALERRRNNTRVTTKVRTRK